MIPRMAAALALLGGPAFAEEPLGGWGRGPFDFRNEHIFSLTHLTLGADSAQTSHRGGGDALLRINVAQTSQVRGNGQFVLDAETVHVAVSARYGLLDWLELGIEMPAVWRYEGFLDWTIEHVEDSYDEPRKARRDRPRDVYEAEGFTDRGLPFDYDEGWGAAKMRLSAKVAILDDPDRLALSAEAIAALPTGTTDFGTTGVDAGLRLVAQRAFGNIHLYFGAAGSVLGPSDDAIQLETLKGTVFFAGEARLTYWVSLVYQVAIESPTTRDLEGHPRLILWHGGGIKVGYDGVTFEIGVVENGGDVKYSMDVALHFALGVRF